MVALTVVASGVGIPIGISSGVPRLCWLAGFLAVLGLLLTLGWARDRRSKLRSKQLQQAKTDLEALRASMADEYETDLAYILNIRLKLMLYLVVDAICEPSRPKRKGFAAEARASLVHTTSDLVGRNALQGETRSNLFLLDDDKRAMRLAPGASTAGGGTQSTRVFDEDSPTLTATLARQPRFVAQTNGRDEEGNPVAYGTYMTHPVAEHNGRIWGVLTVDCANEGDLREKVDMPMMAILSTLIALTYRCES
ncbi:hypothetical protein [Gordonia terrae]